MTMSHPSTTRRTALMGMSVGVAMAGEAYAQANPLSGIMNRLSPQAAQAQTPPQTQQPPMQAVRPGRQELAPLGYALAFQTVRSRLSTGDFTGAMNIYRNGVPAPAAATPTASAAASSATSTPASSTLTMFSSSDVFLSNAELGLMNFDSAGFPDATTCLAAAHEAATIDQQQESGSMFGRLRRMGTRVLRQSTAFMMGRDELAVYVQKDYERILQLNYLALAYLVPGDRRAYNVNRLAIVEQDAARAKFEEDIAAAQQRLGQARADQTNGAEAARATDGFQAEFTRYDGVAGRVPSAYVNPLGYYLSGVIQEITSAERPALRGNARNSYNAALELARTSPQLSAAVAAMQQPPRQGERIMHVIIGDGFAPTRQALLYGVQVGSNVVPVRIPIFTPNATTINRIAVANAAGQPIARLDPIGDVEALVMRSQKDRMPQMLLGVIASAWRSQAESNFAAGMGDIASSVMQFKQSYDSPDMRSWSTLPSKFYVARVTLPPGAQPLRINAYAGSRLVHSQRVTPSADLQHSVIYGRAADGMLRVEQPRRLWIDAIDEAHQ